LRAAGAEVVGMVAIFTYDFAQASEAFKAANVPFICLTNYPSLIALAVEKGYVTKEQDSILLDWRNSPSTWTGK
jgi:orotate phosphoribosyltransferase